MWEASSVFDVVAKARTLATNFLMFSTRSDGLALALGAGVLGVDCAAGEDRVYTWSIKGAAGNGLLVALAVGFWGSFVSSFPLPSSVSIGEVSSFFSHVQTEKLVSEDSKFSISPSCSYC